MIKLKNILNEIYDTNLIEGGSKFKIFCDLDGVLVDFNKAIKQLTGGIDFESYVKNKGYDSLWKIINTNGVIWWATLPWTSDGKQLWNALKNKNVTILTAGSKRNSGDISEKGKIDWCHKNIGSFVPVIVTYNSKEKQKYSKPNYILIDDMPSNITEWNSHGGIGILHKNTEDTLNQLNQILKNNENL